MFFDTLVVRGKCPPGCNACVEVCPQKGSDGLAAIRIVNSTSEAGFRTVSVCNQCSQPECAAACPNEAIARNSQGVVVVNQDLCTGCGSCEEACPYGGIYCDGTTGLAYKCDYCGGQPRCVEACPHGVLAFMRSRPVVGYLQEDLLSPGLPFCAGCPAELAVRFTVRVLGRNIIMFGAPSCTLLAGRAKLPYYGCLMTNVPSSMTGVSRYLRRCGSDAICVSFVGDGTTADVGFQPLSGAAERGERILHICYDNEAYMNTGIQRSSTTPPGAWTTTTQVGPHDGGKTGPSKYVPLLMALHGVAYAATAAVSHLEDYAAKLLKAKAATERGMAYLHLFTPCPTGWRARIEDGIELSRLAVETNYFPLWEWEDGSLRFSAPVERPRPLEEFVRLQGRFAHLSEEDIARLKEVTDSRITLLKKLA
ncbi:MAG: 4Fe-4S binding protein [Clostridia bacterium]|nr:4Fe-4S binding protein [Clostridia bacterium]